MRSKNHSIITTVAEERFLTDLMKEEKSKEEQEFIYSQLKMLKYFNPFIEQFLKGTNKDILLNVKNEF
jgi:hypothetical protein